MFFLKNVAKTLLSPSQSHRTLPSYPYRAHPHPLSLLPSKAFFGLPHDHKRFHELCCKMGQGKVSLHPTITASHPPHASNHHAPSNPQQSLSLVFPHSLHLRPRQLTNLPINHAKRLYFPLPSPDTNLAVIRKQLADYTHLPEHSFKLVHAGAVMKDDNTPSMFHHPPSFCSCPLSCFPVYPPIISFLFLCFSLIGPTPSAGPSYFPTRKDVQPRFHPYVLNFNQIPET